MMAADVITLSESHLARAIVGMRANPLIDNLDGATLAITDAAEHAAYQDAQARAHAAGRLPTADALVIYRALGEIYSPANDGFAAGADLATKICITLAIEEILTGNIRAANDSAGR